MIDGHGVETSAKETSELIGIGSALFVEYKLGDHAEEAHETASIVVGPRQIEDSVEFGTVGSEAVVPVLLLHDTKND